MFESDANFDVIPQPRQRRRSDLPEPTGSARRRRRETQPAISLSDARADDDPAAEVGEEHTREIIFEIRPPSYPKPFARPCRAVSSTCRKRLYSISSKRLEGQLVTGEVYQTWSREILLLDDEKNELLLPKSGRYPATSSARERPCVL